MGMFTLITDAVSYSQYISSFKRGHYLDPFSYMANLHPIKYPCLISSVKAYTENVHNVEQPDGVINICHGIEMVNEVYYRSQAKKLVYPLKGKFTLPRSVKATNDTAELVQFVRTSAWARPIERGVALSEYDELKESLQLKLVDQLYNTVRDRRVVCPYIVSSKNVSIEVFDDRLIIVAAFFVLTMEEARSLVYYKNNCAIPF